MCRRTQIQSLELSRELDGADLEKMVAEGQEGQEHLLRRFGRHMRRKLVLKLDPKKNKLKLSRIIIRQEETMGRLTIELI